MEKGKLYLNRKHRSNPFALEDFKYYVYVHDVKEDTENCKIQWGKIGSCKYMNSVEFSSIFCDVDVNTTPLKILVNFVNYLTPDGRIQKIKSPIEISKYYRDSLCREYVDAIKTRIIDKLEIGKSYKIVDNTFEVQKTS